MNSIVFGLLAILAIFSSQISAQSCGDCEIVVTFIETWVDNNATETQIATYLDVACSTIFSGEQATCDAIIQEGLGEIIGYINQDETPTQVCTQLNFCTSKPKAVKQSDVCGDCEEVIGYIENWLNSTENSEEVVVAVEVVCTFMPEWETTCDYIVAYGVDDLIDFIETEEQPDVVCQQIGACNVTKPAISLKQAECSGCEVVVGYIETWVESNYTVTQIETYLDAICPYIPDFSEQCTEIISQQVPLIVQELEGDESAQAVCTQIGICSSAKKPAHKSLIGKPSIYKKNVAL